MCKDRSVQGPTVGSLCPLWPYEMRYLFYFWPRHIWNDNNYFNFYKEKGENYCFRHLVQQLIKCHETYFHSHGTTFQLFYMVVLHIYWKCSWLLNSEASKWRRHAFWTVCKWVSVSDDQERFEHEISSLEYPQSLPHWCFKILTSDLYFRAIFYLGPINVHTYFDR